MLREAHIAQRRGVCCSPIGDFEPVAGSIADGERRDRWNSSTTGESRSGVRRYSACARAASPPVTPHRIATTGAFLMLRLERVRNTRKRGRPEVGEMGDRRGAQSEPVRDVIEPFHWPMIDRTCCAERAPMLGIGASHAPNPVPIVGRPEVGLAPRGLWGARGPTLVHLLRPRSSGDALPRWVREPHRPARDGRSTPRTCSLPS